MIGYKLRKTFLTGPSWCSINNKTCIGVLSKLDHQFQLVCRRVKSPSQPQCLKSLSAHWGHQTAPGKFEEISPTVELPLERWHFLIRVRERRRVIGLQITPHQAAVPIAYKSVRRAVGKSFEQCSFIFGDFQKPLLPTSWTNVKQNTGDGTGSERTYLVAKRSKTGRHLTHG